NDEGTTVFLTTQYLEEADQLADRVGIIDRGCISAEGTPESLKAEIGGSHLELRIAEGGAERAREVMARFGELMTERDGILMVLLPHGASDVAPIVRALDDAGVAVESLDLVKPTLDDVFVAKTGRHLEGEGSHEADAAPGPAPVEEAAPA